MDLKNSKNILYLTYTLEPAGAERMIFSLAANINQNYNPIVCSLKRGGDLVKDLRSKNIKVYVLKKKKGFDFSIIGQLKKIILQEKIDLIHSHNFSANLWGRVAGKLVKVQLIITTEHSLSTNKNRLQKIVDYILSLITDQIIAVSEAVKNSHILAEKISPKKIMTIYNGIDLEQFDDITPPDQLRTKLGIHCDTPIVGIVGRLTQPKGHFYFLDAAKIILSEMPSTLFMIVGDGELMNELIKYCRNNSIDKSVMFCGFRKDRLDIMNLFSVAVLSSLREGLPLTLLEYMALKKAIVVTDVGGMPEVIDDGSNGFVVPAGDSKYLSKKILKLLYNKEESLSMGIKAHRLIKAKFTEKMMVERTVKLYNSLLKKKCGI